MSKKLPEQVTMLQHNNAHKTPAHNSCRDHKLPVSHCAARQPASCRSLCFLCLKLSTGSSHMSSGLQTLFLLPVLTDPSALPNSTLDWAAQPGWCQPSGTSQSNRRHPSLQTSGLALKPNPDLGMGWVTCHPLFHHKALSHTDLVALCRVQLHGT